MKRIIEGTTYNTDTATLIAEATHEDEDKGAVREGSLYQTRTGVYFFVDKVTTSYRDRHGDVQQREHYDWEAVGDAAAAREFCEQWSMTILRDIEDMPPEAELGEKLATLYVRLPPALKSAVEAEAKQRALSVNVFAMRCLEDGVGIEAAPGVASLNKQPGSASREIPKGSFFD